jgi:serine/threonine protein kinase/tetratricopeptide (TPR) repeat protein
MTDEELFHDALQKPPGERATFLNEACRGDDTLRQRVEILLAAHAAPGSFLASPAVELNPTVDLPSAIEGPGTTIGPYKLLEHIGEGGFGTVFLAEQSVPVRRKVALKVLKPGMDTRQVVARFEAERQALAIMDHPNIARVFDGGISPSVRPYFVMELVKGVPITDFCDQHHLTPRQRLELFVSVCQAVQHAHQKGIVHRDLKPSNVLVSRHDTTPVVKVIDFGIAKALGQELTDKTLFTGVSQMIGTPLYMSPEQAGMSDLDIDTRSDIYSLGVLLYELLTGTTPFTKERFKKAAYDEIRRIIQEEEPPKPSTRLSDSTDSLPSVAAQRQTEPVKLTKLVRGELDWIVMKGLEKDRNRRYQTANGFAGDLLRYLSGEAVLAVPPSTGYRLRKFARRNKGPVLAVSLVFLALVAGVVGTAWQALRTERAREETAKYADGERLAKERAETNFALASEAVETYLGKVTEDRDLKRADFNLLRKRLLESAIPFFQKLSAGKSDDPNVEAQRGRAFLRLGQVREALGEHEAAVQDFEAGRALFARLSADFPKAPVYRHDWARSLGNLGGILRHLGKYVEAEAAYRQAGDIFDKLTIEFQNNPEYRSDMAKAHHNLGILLFGLGKSEEANLSNRRARDINEKLTVDFPTVPKYRSDLAANYRMLGQLLNALKKREVAEEASRQAVTISEQLATDYPDVPEYHRDLAGHLNNLGIFLAESGKSQEAKAIYRQALNIKERIAADFPSVPEYRRDLARSHNNLGALLDNLGKPGEAETAYRRAISIDEKLVADFPTVPAYRVSLAGSFCNFGIWSRQKNQSEAALDCFQKAIMLLEPVVAQDQRQVTARQFLRNSHCAKAELLEVLSRDDEAASDWEHALKLDDGSNKLHFRRQIARNKKDAAGCLAVAEEHEGSMQNDAGWLYLAMCHRAVCAAVIPVDPKIPAADAARLAKVQADKAMAWLHKAVAAGSQNAENLMTNPDLKALHGREDFKKLITDLKSKKK